MYMNVRPKMKDEGESDVQNWIWGYSVFNDIFRQFHLTFLGKNIWLHPMERTFGYIQSSHK